MTTIHVSLVIRPIVLGTILLAADAAQALAQQSQSDPGRPRLLRRLRDTDPPERSQSNKPNNSSQNAQAAKQLPKNNQPAHNPAARNQADARSLANQNAIAPAQSLPSQPLRPGVGHPSAQNRLPQHDISPKQPVRQNPAVAKNLPTLLPPNRIPVPTLAPPLQPRQPNESIPQSDSQLDSVLPQRTLLDSPNLPMIQNPSAGLADLPNAEGRHLQFGMSLRDEEGIVTVMAIVPGGSADRDGLLNGDILQSIGGVTLQDLQEFYEVAGLMQTGDQIEVVVLRSGQEKTILLSIGEVPASAGAVPSSDWSVKSLQQASSQFKQTPVADNDSWELTLSDPNSSGFEININPEAAVNPEDGHLSGNSNEDSIRETISRKEREIQELMQQVEALKRRLAGISKTHGF